ncbi:hypothetical protein [Changchengzhania lutea]|uniref:hypothetical protein n=1 Tax=Changchengzhania lutea TaxID=2049305 RepID=UPI00115D7DA2|nr:hypothetical protein [Changchengzhania lutea]
MPSHLKKTLIILSTVFITVLSLLTLANYLIKKEISDYLDALPQQVKVQYKDISVNALLGNATLKHTRFAVYGNTTKKIKLQVGFKDISVENLSYWDMLFNDKISINDIKLHQPNIIYYRDMLADRPQYSKFLSKSKGKLITINNFEIINGKAKVLDKDSLLFSTKRLNLKLNNVSNKVSNNKNMPIAFTDFNVLAKSVELKLGEFESLHLGAFRINNTSASVKSIALKTIYSKEDFSKQIKNERDHYSVTADSIICSSLELGFKQDSIFNVEGESMTIFKPKLAVYRDKLVADNYKQKNLYSKTLRDLSFDLALHTINIVEGEFLYEESVNYNAYPGKLRFTALESRLKNVSNTYGEGSIKTTIETDAIFMENTSIKSHWEFDVNNINDNFIFKAQVGMLKAAHMNQFMEPNLNIKLKGELLETYFTIDGNNHASAIDLKMNYDEFAIEVLKANGREKNKLLSTIANLLVSNNSKKRKSNFSEGKKTGIERDKTKSVFNFLWLSVKAGLIDAMM